MQSNPASRPPLLPVPFPQAPLENHHCAAAFTQLQTPALNFTADMPKADYDRMRKVGWAWVHAQGWLGMGALVHGVLAGYGV